MKVGSGVDLSREHPRKLYLGLCFIHCVIVLLFMLNSCHTNRYVEPV